MSRRDLDEWLWQVGAELQRISEEITPGNAKFVRSTYWEPRVDVIESEEALIVVAELAGVQLGDVRVVYDGEANRLILRGHRDQVPLLDGPGNVHQLEVIYGDFERVIQLPDLALRPESAHSNYRDGFLILCLPKVRTQKGEPTIRRRITIRHS